MIKPTLLTCIYWFVTQYKDICQLIYYKSIKRNGIYKITVTIRSTIRQYIITFERIIHFYFSVLSLHITAKL